MPFDEAIRRLAETWRDSPQRPRVSAEVLDRWDRMLEDWIDAEDLPLLLRVSKGIRGEALRHHGGRLIVCADNAPANWALSCAIQGRVPAISDIGHGLETGRIPVAFALRASERAVARYKGTQRTKMEPPNLNTLGWTVCHVIDIGLNERAAVTGQPYDRLARHFRLFMNPRNMFVMPKAHAGIGEARVFQEIFRTDPWFGRLR